ncbi:hypothetical protein PRIPAC_70742 [Pristionchus pacificus]|uniref:Uncharacterized protein n=1 Tax=Pristionchus pacificus TaxID=54126 RepID=A0A2A6C6H7_PRIPA|nr:hypothetical protein PRIPAC_70742 [Pristionchus pacificus]|eukprot:PDM73720.1 hypothetical protein PRIPAC_41076 [Pristionchus pacificus]
MIQVGDTRRVAQADGRGFSKLGMEESGGESRPPVASARMENAYTNQKKTNGSVMTGVDSLIRLIIRGAIISCQTALQFPILFTHLEVHNY